MDKQKSYTPESRKLAYVRTIQIKYVDRQDRGLVFYNKENGLDGSNTTDSFVNASREIRNRQLPPTTTVRISYTSKHCVGPIVQTMDQHIY